MKIKKLEITGFKSFHEKTQIELPPGISAIVGPNGCGKSNIVDAIKWVMGEQSVKQLRGKSMDDIIFAGTNGMSPLNMAEVSLTVLNDNGSVPEDLKEFNEILVTRRLYRSGERSYFINKRPCRLKDIHNLFLGSGSASKSYSVIQQGTIGLITEAGPEEKKMLIEEAAGVSRFKKRKTEALQKVDKTNQNLARINDIITEIQRQMNGLQRQAKKAEQYKTYKENIKRLDIIIALHYYNDFNVDINKSEMLLKELKDSDIGLSSKLNKLDSAVEKIKLKYLQKNQAISEQSSEKFELQRNIDKIENNVAHLHKDIKNLLEQTNENEKTLIGIQDKNREIIKEIDQIKNITIDKEEKTNRIKQRLQVEKEASQTTKNKLEEINKEMEGYKSNLIRLVSDEAKHNNIFETAKINKEKINRSLKKKDEESLSAKSKVRTEEKIVSQKKLLIETLTKSIYDLDIQLKDITETLKTCNDDLNITIKQRQSIEMDHNKAISEYNTLKKMEDGYEWYKNGVKAIMRQDTIKGTPEENTFIPSEKIIGLLSDVLEPEPSYEASAEAALGESLQYILVENQHVGIQLIDFLQKNNAGRCGLIPVSHMNQKNAPELKTNDTNNKILDHIKVKQGFEKIADTILGHTLIADNLNDAITISKNNGYYRTIVTKEGDIVTNDGIIIGGSKDTFPQIFKKKNRIKELETQISKINSSLETKRTYQYELESKIINIESNLQEAIQKKSYADREKLDAEKDLYKSEENYRYSCRLLETITLEKDRLYGEDQDLDDEISKYSKTIQEISSSIAYTENKIVETKENTGSILYEMETFNQKIIDLNLSLTTLGAELENNRSTMKRLITFRDEGENQIKQLQLDISNKKQNHITSTSKLEELKNIISEDYDSLERLVNTIDRTKEEYKKLEDHLTHLNNTISDINHKREGVLNEIRKLEIELSQKHIKKENIAGSLYDRYSRPIEELSREIHITSDSSSNGSNIDINQLENELSDLRTKISKIDDVNLNAINEYAQLNSRYSFLCEQRDDLTRALEDLHQVIKKINKITKEKFLNTFNMINEKLCIVFPRLFEGGSAKLMLTEPENPLDTGVEYMIHLAGKKLSRLSLLSGGEKALAAIALVFSIFLIKPASFCLMDEIDAALDDANVFRFNDLLKIIGEKSQILMISHNKNSMKLSDNLFGITMEKKGISKIVSVDLRQA
jgi:chromosome segregation protein